MSKDIVDRSQAQNGDYVMYEVQNDTDIPSGIFGYGYVGLAHGPVAAVEEIDSIGILRRYVKPRGGLRVLLSNIETD